MTIEAMKQVLEALENVRSYDKGDLYGLDEDIAAIRAAIEQAESDWSLLEATQESLREHMAEIQRLKQRQWVGLTAEEIWACYKTDKPDPEYYILNALDFAEAIEAKLKEKNDVLRSV